MKPQRHADGRAWLLFESTEDALLWLTRSAECSQEEVLRRVGVAWYNGDETSLYRWAEQAFNLTEGTLTERGKA